MVKTKLVIYKRQAGGGDVHWKEITMQELHELENKYYDDLALSESLLASCIDTIYTIRTIDTAESYDIQLIALEVAD